MSEFGYAFQNGFYRRHPNARSVIELFNYLPGIYFYAKDTEHRYFAVNRPVWEEVFGLVDESEVLGRSDLEFQAPALAEAYHAEDRRVMDGRITVANEVWLVPHVQGAPRWYVSTKVPVLDPDENVIGIAGAMYPIDRPDEQVAYFRELSPVIRHMEENFSSEISMESMAAIADLSSTQFNQRFRALFRMSPTEYLLKLRVESARRLLTRTHRTIGEIALETGFYDQSHFTKRFRKATGLTPRQYRLRFRKG